MNLLITLILALSISQSLAYGAESTSSITPRQLVNGFSLNDFSVNLSAGYQQSLWFPSVNDSTNAPQIVNFTTEGLQAYRIDTKLSYSSIPFISLHYEAPVNNTPDQREMLEFNTKKAGLEKFVGGIDFSSLPAQFGYGNNRWINTLASVKYVYTQELFFINALATRNFWYIPSNASYDPQTNIMNGQQLVSAGDNIRYKTRFIDHNVSIDLFKMLSGELYNNYEIRLGYFNTIWDRPSQNVNSGGFIGDRPGLYDTRYTAQGAMLNIESRNLLNNLVLGIYGGIGLRQNIENVKAPDFSNNFSSNTNYGANDYGDLQLINTGGYASYSFDLGKVCKNCDKLGMELGSHINYRGFYQKNNSVFSFRTESSEMLIQVNGNLTYKF